MSLKRALKLILVTSLLCVANHHQALGDLVIEFQDTSEGLGMTMSGTLDTTGLTLFGPDPSPGLGTFIDDGTGSAPAPIIQAGGDAMVLSVFATPRVALSSIIKSTASGTNSGDYFAYSDIGTTAAVAFEAPPGFISGDMISTRPNALFGKSDTIASIFGTSLGKDGIVLADFANGETLSIRSISAVPEPASMTLLVGMALPGILRRRSRVAA